MKYFSYTIIAIVLAAIITGFFFVQSPAQVRLLRLDDQRVYDLENIQWKIIEYWQSKDELPVSLDLLVNNIDGYQPPVDPVTGNSYAYKVTEPLSFELCATFSLASIKGGATQPTPVYRDYGYDYGNWQHSAGEQCFTRTIDPEIYKTNKLIK